MLREVRVRPTPWSLWQTPPRECVLGDAIGHEDGADAVFVALSVQPASRGTGAAALEKTQTRITAVKGAVRELMAVA